MAAFDQERMALWEGDEIIPSQSFLNALLLFLPMEIQGPFLNNL